MKTFFNVFSSTEIGWTVRIDQELDNKIQYTHILNKITFSLTNKIILAFAFKQFYYWISFKLNRGKVSHCQMLLVAFMWSIWIIPVVSFV